MKASNWKDFMLMILRDFRTSDYRLEKEHGIPQTTIYQIRTGIVKKPQQRTIAMIEKAFGIRIDDTDPSNLCYVVLTYGSVN